MLPLILLTNDDGIDSPGLWAAAHALDSVGEVVVAAPRQQYSGAGRSLPSSSDGVIETRSIHFNGKDWKAYAVGGSPAQVVLHGILEILPRLPDLVVVGINFGENIGSGITISGTVGAALEAAAMGVRSLAVSLETDIVHHHITSDQVDFSTAAHFSASFARRMLHKKFSEDIHVIKVDIPSSATPDTPWQITRQSLTTYFIATRPMRTTWDQPERIGYALSFDPQKEPPGTDVYALCVQRQVSVTPISLDLTSRVKMDDLDQLLRDPEELTRFRVCLADHRQQLGVDGGVGRQDRVRRGQVIRIAIHIANHSPGLGGNQPPSGDIIRHDRHFPVPIHPAGSQVAKIDRSRTEAANTLGSQGKPGVKLQVVARGGFDVVGEPGHQQALDQ